MARKKVNKGHTETNHCNVDLWEVLVSILQVENSDIGQIRSVHASRANRKPPGAVISGITCPRRGDLYLEFAKSRLPASLLCNTMYATMTCAHAVSLNSAS